MTGVLIWWHDRLKARFPLRDQFKIAPQNYKPKDGAGPDVWPGRVARYTLYDDYRGWFAEQNAILWPHLEEDQRPKCPNELAFFTTLGPYLYVRDKNQMTRTYFVSMPVLFEGKTRMVKKRRYFIRLAPYEEHVDAYLRQTGHTSL